MPDLSGFHLITEPPGNTIRERSNGRHRPDVRRNFAGARESPRSNRAQPLRLLNEQEPRARVTLREGPDQELVAAFDLVPVLLSDHEAVWKAVGSRQAHGPLRYARMGGHEPEAGPLAMRLCRRRRPSSRSGLYVESTMKVLYVSHTSLVSGAEGALLDLLEALPEDVSPVVACPPGPLADVLIARNVTVKRLPEFSASFRLDARGTPHAAVELLIAGQALRRIVRATRPDLVHANSLRAGLVAGAALIPRSIPVIVHCHDALPPSKAAALVTALLKRTSDDDPDHLPERREEPC